MFISMKINKKAVFFTAVGLLLGAAFLIVFSKVRAYARENPENSIKVPIVMYHSVLKDESKSCDYVVTPVKLEEDILWLNENGYTPVSVNDLILYVNGQEDLPDKPVVLTFDDGFYNNYTYVFPLLKKYNIKSTISVVGSYSDEASECAEPNPNYSYLRWKEIAEMRNSGLVEFSNHTYNMHSTDGRQGTKQLDGETYEDYRGEMLVDIDRLQQEFESHCGFRPNVFAYPYGFVCENGERIVKNMGFNASLGVEEKINTIIKGDKSCLYNLHRYNRPGNVTSQYFFEETMGM